MRLLADMGVSPKIVEWLRGAGHDVAELREQGLERSPDADIFEKAAVEARTILTFDLDFGEIVALSGGRTISVIVFRLPDARPATVIDCLANVLAQSTAAIEAGAIVVVEPSRHRVRRLPFAPS